MKAENPLRETNDLKIITVTSGKGGVGKSNFVANTAISLSRMDKRVVILDADFGFANIDVIFNSKPVYSFMDIIKKDIPIDQVLTPGPEGVQFISGASEIHQLQDIDEDDYNKLIRGFNELANIADILIIDTGAGLQQTASRFMSISDEIIVVTTPDPTAITDAYSLVKSLITEKVYSNQKIHLVVNMSDDQKEALEVHTRLSSAFTRFLNVQVNELGGIPFDSKLRASVKEQLPVTLAYPNSKAAKSFGYIASSLCEQKIIKEKRSISNIVKSILGMK